MPWGHVLVSLTVSVCAIVVTVRLIPVLGQVKQVATDTDRTIWIVGKTAGQQQKFWHEQLPGIVENTNSAINSLSLAGKGLVPVEDSLTTELAALHDTTTQTTQTLATASTTLQGVNTDVRGLTESARGTLDATTATVEGLQPLESSATKSMQDFDNIWITSPHAASIMANVDTTGQHVAHMSIVTDEWETKVTACTRHPTAKCIAENLLTNGIILGGSVRELMQ